MLTLNRDAALEMKQERQIGCWSPKDSDLTRQRRTVVKGRLGSRLPPSPFLFFFYFQFQVSNWKEKLAMEDGDDFDRASWKEARRIGFDQ